MGSQFDLGFDTGKKLWFIQGFNPTRWGNGMIQVRDANIELKNVLCDTYSYPDPRTDTISHGRIRFYGGNKIETIGDESVFNSVKITGSDNKFNFIEIQGKKVLLKYNLPSMDWEIDIDGTKLITKDIKGPFTGTLLKDKLRFVLKDVKILYSNLVTLIDPELEVKKPKTKPITDKGRCIQEHE